MQINQQAFEQLKNNIQSCIQELASQKKRDRRVAITWSVIIPIVIAGAFLILNPHHAEPFKTAAYIAFGSCVVCNVIFFGYFGNRRNSKYKEVVMPQLVQTALPGCTYNVNGLITKDMVKETKVFSVRGKDFNTEDSITGVIGQTRFTFCEMLIEHSVNNGDNNETVTDFKGFVLKADFNKHFNGHTVVFNRKSRLKNDIGFFSHLKRCELEDVNFEDRFKTYTTDDQEARYILTPSLQQRILELGEMLKARISVVFYEENMLLMADDNRNHFEVKYKLDDVWKDLEAVGRMTDIVEQLNLNLRIWSKE